MVPEAKAGEMATAVVSARFRFSADSVASVEGVWAWTAGAGEKSSAPATASSRSRASWGAQPAEGAEGGRRGASQRASG